MCVNRHLLTRCLCLPTRRLKKKATFRVKSGAPECGSPGGTRTPDQLVNSQLLYRLSYRGIISILICRSVWFTSRSITLSFKAVLNRQTDDLLSIGIEQILGVPDSSSATREPPRVAHFNAAPVPIFATPATSFGGAWRANRYGDIRHTKKNYPGSRTRNPEPLL
jgi:hypothetical protein